MALQEQQKKVFYFVDGYHGGTWGHMPPGAWRDIIEAMRRHPHWKISLDIEPVSWQTLKSEDPVSYSQLQELLRDSTPAARMEMVAASYAQPFAWAISGESNIRHLARGRELVAEHFPDLVVDTYAVQEPCWTSAMPQILASFDFKRAVLKNPTAWGGYFAGFDAEIVNVEGPDGSNIPCVPRYACEDLVGCHAIESAGYQLVGKDGDVTTMMGFVEKCRAHGIERPSGMCLQDLGWPAGPWLNEDFVRFVTWREYFAGAPQPRATWRFSQEDVLCVLPWGERTLQRIARQVRRAEHKAIQAEKMASFIAAWRGAPYPREALQEAWDNVLYAQHHDIWICATTREGRKAWAWQADHATARAEEPCDRVIREAFDRLCEDQMPADEPRVVVMNTLGSPRHELAEATLVLPAGTRSVTVEDASGAPVPVQVRPLRRYRDGSWNTAQIVFPAAAPAFGFAAYKVRSHRDGASHAERAVQVETADSEVVIESDLYRIVLDPQGGGVLRSLYHKGLGREFCSPDGSGRAFNELRGYFIEEERWHSSVDHPAAVDVLEDGPLRARVQVAGQVGRHGFRQIIEVAAGEPLIQFELRMDFPQDTWVGDPWEVPVEARRSERRRSQHDDRWKLHVAFPIPCRRPELYKDAPFDVCRSRHENTFFQSWDEIKHNIVLNWVDLFDADSGYGLAVLSDHTTSYLWGEGHPLGLTVAWGWEGGFWWGKCPLRGRQEMRYALLPHRGRWDEAHVWWARTRWSEPYLVSAAHGSFPVAAGSLFALTDPGIELSAVQVEGNDLLVRVFNAAGAQERCDLVLHRRPERAELVELDGRFVASLPVREQAEASFVSFPLPRFGFRTVRLVGLASDRDGGR